MDNHRTSHRPRTRASSAPWLGCGTAERGQPIAPHHPMLASLDDSTTRRSGDNYGWSPEPRGEGGALSPEGFRQPLMPSWISRSSRATGGTCLRPYRVEPADPARRAGATRASAAPPRFDLLRHLRHLGSQCRACTRSARPHPPASSCTSVRVGRKRGRREAHREQQKPVAPLMSYGQAQLPAAARAELLPGARGHRARVLQPRDGDEGTTPVGVASRCAPSSGVSPHSCASSRCCPHECEARRL